MPWTKVPKENEDALEKALTAIPEAEKKKMFGCPAYFINGNMFAGAHQEAVFVRLSEIDEDALMKIGGVPFTPMPGRAMKGYTVVPQSIFHSDEFAGWLLKSRDYVCGLPMKEKKPAK
jgi:TfoX/Sxy family transcriptional regulator of competence genes